MNDILFAVSNECCESLEVSLKNNAFQSQGFDYEGNYKIQPVTFNGRSVWSRDVGSNGNRNVLWFSITVFVDKLPQEEWVIGPSVGNRGIGKIFGPGSFKCPNEVGSQWTYLDDGTELVAGNDLSVNCQGKEQ